MRRLSALVTAGVMAASLFISAGTAAAADGDATVWIVHGVPGATVEVCVDGVAVKDDFAYRKKFSALLPEGDHTFALFANGANCVGTPIDKANITRAVAMDGNYTIVATPSVQTGNVRFYWFSNKMSNTTRGAFRLSLRHAAVVPGVNVFMNRVRMTKPALTQGSSKTLLQPWGSYVVRVKRAGVGTTLFGPRTLSFASRTAVQLYLVGDSTVGYRFVRINQDVIRPV